MNSNYHKWLEIEITNNYFEKDTIAFCDVVPFEETKRAFKNYELLMDRNDNRITFYVGAKPGDSYQATEAFNGLEQLHFLLMNQDALFFNYTDIPLPVDEQMYYFKNGNQAYLQEGAYVSTKDQVVYVPQFLTLTLPDTDVNIQIKDGQGKVLIQEQSKNVRSYPIKLNALPTGYYELWLDGQLSRKMLVTGQEIPQGCFAVLTLNIEDILAKSDTESTIYTLDFNARSALFQYQVVVSDRRKITIENLSITDELGIDYSGPVAQKIIGNQSAQVFTTTDPVKLVSNRKAVPQLQIQYTNEYSDRLNQMNRGLPQPNIEDLQTVNTGMNSGEFLITTIVYV